MRSIFTARKVCPNCRAWKNQVKNGKNPSGSKRTKCNACGKTYTVQVRSNQYPRCYPIAAMWFAHAYTYRQIAEMFDVTPQTVVNWIKKYEKGFYLSVKVFNDLVALVPDVYRTSLADHIWQPEKQYCFPLLQEHHQFGIRHPNGGKTLRKLGSYMRRVQNKTVKNLNAST